VHNGKDAHEAPAEEGNIIVINTCGFIDMQKAESVNMILEYADKKGKRFSRQGFCNRMFVGTLQT
jgi:tRNA A37 methylthiotransferase MiaB